MRDLGLDLLGFTLNTGNHYACIVPELQKALAATRSKTIVDLCSGGGGPWLSLSAALQADGARQDIVLTDLFPNLAAFERVAAARSNVRFESRSVDATNFPPGLNGFRTLFTSFHHFKPDMARAI